MFIEAFKCGAMEVSASDGVAVVMEEVGSDGGSNVHMPCAVTIDLVHVHMPCACIRSHDAKSLPEQSGPPVQHSDALTSVYLLCPSPGNLPSACKFSKESFALGANVVRASHWGHPLQESCSHID